MLHDESLRVVVRAHGIGEFAARDERTFGDVARPNYQLPGIRPDLVWVTVEIAYHGIHLDTLIDVARNDSVVITFFLHILIICVSAPVAEEKRTMYVAFDCCRVGREGEEQLVKAPYMLAGFDGTVLRKVLRKCHHQRFALVQYIDFLTLRLGEMIGFYDTENRYQSAQTEKR